MKLAKQGLLLFSLLLLAGSAIPSANNDEARKLYFGIEENRLPYSELVKGINAEGILVETVRTLCQTMNAECHFVGGEPDLLLQMLQNHQLDALLVVDAILLPDIDKLQFTSPLCRIRPIFMQQQQYSSIEAVINSAIIGVQQDSLLHLYLLDEYAGNARLRTYSLLENGLFDLAFGRIDAVFAGQAFFHAHASRIKKYLPTLKTVQMSEPTLAAGAMSVAVSQHNKALFNQLEQAIQDLNGDNSPDCADMFDDQYAPPVTHTNNAKH